MGLRFRKSFPLGSLFRVNLSKSGVSLGVGPRGLNFNIGPRGVRRTVGLPGTGLFYQDNQSWKQVAADTPETAETANPANAAGGVSWLKVLIGLVAIVLFVKACDTMTSSNNRSISTATSASVNAAQSSASASQAALTAEQSKPKNRSLNRDEMKELQSLLARSGYPPGPVDGKLGPRTRAAVQAFRTHSGDAAAGDPTLATLARLRAAKH